MDTALAKDLLFSGLRIILILGGGILFSKVLSHLISKLRGFLIPAKFKEDPKVQRRADTISGILFNLGKIGIWGIVTFMILSQLNIDIKPILAGAGIVGLAVGFGAQSLVKDFISGFFVILEEQFDVGDIVKIGDHGGVVEKMTLRTTQLRGVNGDLVIIPNSEISRVIVMTKGWSRALIDFEVAYKESIAEVKKVIEEVASQTKKDNPDWFLGDPEIWGVETLGSNGVSVRLVMKTAPASQWAAMRKLRENVKARFDELGIEIPFPQLTLHRPDDAITDKTQ